MQFESFFAPPQDCIDRLRFDITAQESRAIELINSKGCYTEFRVSLNSIQSHPKTSENCRESRQLYKGIPDKEKHALFATDIFNLLDTAEDHSEHGSTANQSTPFGTDKQLLEVNHDAQQNSNGVRFSQQKPDETGSVQDKETVQKAEQDDILGQTLAQSKKHRNRELNCVHAHEKYYAKGYCQTCYHQVGRYKRKAVNCVHSEMPDYAKGLCKSCYINYYRKQRRRMGVKS